MLAGWVLCAILVITVDCTIVVVVQSVRAQALRLARLVPDAVPIIAIDVSIGVVVHLVTAHFRWGPVASGVGSTVCVFAVFPSVAIVIQLVAAVLGARFTLGNTLAIRISAVQEVVSVVVEEVAALFLGGFNDQLRGRPAVGAGRQQRE